MATRREMQERRAKLREQLVEACADGTQKAGSMLPPVRELARIYGVSPALASEVVRSLADEGLLYTEKGSGTFVGRKSTRDDLFLLVVPDVMVVDPDYFEVRIGIRNGFESYLTRLGGSCLTLNFSKARELLRDGHLHGLVGVAEFCFLEGEIAWESPEPLVAIRELWFPKAEGDFVYIDNVDAGRQATQHLLNLGHRRIVYIGAHPEGTAYAGSLDWSRQRQEGWQAALEQAGCETAGLAICPPSMPENATDAFHQIGVEAGRRLLPMLTSPGPAVSAVIGSSGHTTEGLLEVLKDARVAEDRWPAIVSFDDFMLPSSHLMSVLRPSWEELARLGAALLWERTRGRLEAEPQQRALAMELIPRLSCRPQKSNLPRTAMYAMEPRAVAL